MRSDPGHKRPFLATHIVIAAVLLGTANCDGDETEGAPVVEYHTVRARKQDLRAGERLYRQYCSVCHGEDGKGKGRNISLETSPKPYPRNFVDAKFQSGITDEVLENTIRLGGRGVGRSPLMPAWGKTLTERQIEQIILYVRTLPERARIEEEKVKRKAEQAAKRAEDEKTSE